METSNNMKALFIIVKAGFSEEIIQLAKTAGSKGATIINARGEGCSHKTFMGITIDSEREIVLMLIEENIAKNIMKTVKEDEALKPAHAVSFIIPVERTTKINNF